MTDPAPWIRSVLQTCVVVEDLDATIAEYWERAGIGPWYVWVPKLTGMRIRGQEIPYSMKLALAWTPDGVMWEVIQPLTGPSIYREFLDRRREGLHHVLVDAGEGGYDALIAQAEARGLPPMMEGTWAGAQFAYLDGEGPLKMAIEVVRRPADYVRPDPDYTLPAWLGRAPR
ncbi:VOC family protein [uncultured Albimonas sp.]|uniref:VOC family protein n=1 Tax=uncultured Albimonas sp. TaxID=1331701 RepID=UPI0030EF3DC0|tara:strand:- start:13309 stop:13824 length:516 start_codon:yes stop_codon:yes gene_type:complete